MFEKMENQRPEIYLSGGEPIEFTYKGQRYRIYALLSSWRESGGWWNRASDGLFRPDDGGRILWRVEAAPIGVMKTFEIERIEVIPEGANNAPGLWQIRPTSRPA
jgi:hypothetical protein